MPRYGLFIIGERDNPRKIFGWRSPALNNEVFLVAGPYKMVSLFMRVLMTPKGDIIGRPGEGTEFFDLLNGNVSDAVELQARMEAIFDDTFAQVQEIQQRTSLSGEIEDNELLIGYAIQDFFVSTDGTKGTVRVELSNAAGETVPGLIPLNDPFA